ncbi:hypothetical protein TNIN_4771 [Trichonephila inaurata madagascariensis]|uniref:Uncharacterized protein n=1 Tax=Trichonephila inaurata madagascariensis TaxID=2747483 RepID=A0A8X7BV22_9ARAC|nr:hypothetical protein TNIN_4771 [Trichonephila inaurata madagascariensis]
MREKVGNIKTNSKKPSKKQKKETRQFVFLSGETPLDSIGESFDEDNNDDLRDVYKEYFYDKKGPKCDWIQCIECNIWLHEYCNGNHLH